MMVWLLFGVFLVLCVLRVPIAFSMLISATVAIAAEGDVPLVIVPQRMWVGLNNFPLLAVPFFLFVANAMNESGASGRLIDFTRAGVGWIRGGLAQVNVVVSMIFAGISGVSSAETLGIGTILIPAMKREGYPAGFAAGLTAASSTLGNIIPPSLMMIIYAATAGLSVGRMFLSGIVPGLLIGFMQMAWSSHYAKRLRIGEATPFSVRTFGATGRKAAAALVIPLIIIGGILGGAFTATEASVIAVGYVLFVAMIGRQLTLRHLYKLTEDSVGMFSLSLLCVAAASLWGWVLAFYGVPQAVVAWLAGLGLLGSKVGIFSVVIFVFLLVGTFMDAVPAIIILQPIVGGITAAGGIDPYHMGLVVVLTLAIGLLTPPYGLCLLIAADLAEITTVEAVRALVPFYVISLIAVIVAVLFPDLMLMIPRMAMAGLAR